MIATKIEAKPAESFKREVVLELVHAGGPCLTLLLPPYRPGTGEAPATLLKTALQDAAVKLAAWQIEEPVISDLLEPLRQLSHEEEPLGGSGSTRVIFRSPGLLYQFELPVAPPHARTCTVAGSFWLRPILNSAALPAYVYVLEVTKKSVGLVSCGFTGFTAVELPEGTPRTLDEALAFKAPDHDLKNRSASGPSSGAQRGVPFGTGSGRETQHAHLHDFYRMIDRGVNQLLRWNQAPLILAGVEEDAAIYRSISTYPHLVQQGMPGNPGAPMTAAQMLRNAHEIALLDIQRKAVREVAESKERLGAGRFSIHLADILQAAVEGRVSDLYLDENAERTGNFDGKVFGGGTNWHDEDLLNIAAVETLLHGGAVHSLPSHLMIDGAVAAAAFRY